MKINPLLLTALVLTTQLQHPQAELLSCNENLPRFRAPGFSFVLPVRKQILLPSQRFTCSGSIKQWGVAVSGYGNIHLQVWRPLPNTAAAAATGYSNSSFKLVGSNTFQIRPSLEKLLYLTPGRKETLAVQRGDVLGVYIEVTREGEEMRFSYLISIPGSAIYAYDAETPLGYVRAGSPASWVWLNAAPIMTVLLDSSTVVGAATSSMAPRAPSSTTSRPVHFAKGTTSTGSTPTNAETAPTSEKLIPPTQTTNASGRAFIMTEPLDTPTAQRSDFKPVRQIMTASPKKNKGSEPSELTFVLLVVITTTVVVIATIGVCLVSALMVVKQLSQRMEEARRKQLKKILPKLSPPPTSPPPAPPLSSEHNNLTLSVTSKKERGLHEKLTSSLSSSLTASLLWWLSPPLKGSRFHAFIPREYETPIITKIALEGLERSQNHYDVPIAFVAAAAQLRSDPTTCCSHSDGNSHHYEEVA